MSKKVQDKAGDGQQDDQAALAEKASVLEAAEAERLATEKAKLAEGSGGDDAGEKGAPPAGEQIGVKSSADKASSHETPSERIVPPGGSIGDPPLEDGEPVGWDKIAELLSMQGLGGDGIPLLIMEAAEQFFLDVFADAHFAVDADEHGVLNGATSNESSALGRYILERSPTAEVLFNKARELGAYEGYTFADLSTAQRASLELAVRVGPAVKAAIDAVLAEADARHPPPKIPLRGRPVAVEDTIFEQVHGTFERM